MTSFNEIVVMNVVATIIIMIILLTQLNNINEKIHDLEITINNITSIIDKIKMKNVYDIFDN